MKPGARLYPTTPGRDPQQPDLACLVSQAHKHRTSSADLLDVPDELLMSTTVVDEQPPFVKVRHVLRLPRRAVVPIETESERFNVFVTLVNVGERPLARNDPLDDCPTCFISMLQRK